MARVIVSAAASADQIGILKDLNAKAGLRTAIKFRALFKAVYERLGDHPDSGAPRPAIAPNIRIGVVSPYIVIYRHNVDDGAVTVLRIVHGRHRITGAILDETP